MAILPIRLYPDPILRRPARLVRQIEPAIQKLARDMMETLDCAQGVGLAGNQVGVLRRLVALHLPEEDPFVIINPEITRQSGQREVQEGCLSFPGYFGMVTRAVEVTANALSTEGRPIELDATELLAQAIEHEIDHLNGILFIDHIQAHDALWKAGEEPAPHDHGDIDFHHEADHGRVLASDEQAAAGTNGGSEVHSQDEEPARPLEFSELAPYRNADFTAFEEALEAQKRRLAARARGEA